MDTYEMTDFSVCDDLDMIGFFESGYHNRFPKFVKFCNENLDTLVSILEKNLTSRLDEEELFCLNDFFRTHEEECVLVKISHHYS